MPEYQTIRRVTIYANAALEETLIKHCLALGSTGYTVCACRGKGRYGIVEDLLAPTSEVRIELMVKPDAADKIMAYLEEHHLKSQAVSACLETIQVPKCEHY
jgi:hypothetical protein